MRILALTLRNYRLHRELRVDFDQSRTLIGGDNETGKSTIIEAIHRALFLIGKGNTEHHRAMISSLHGGHPEVEVEFEASGKSYSVKKRFGTAGTTTLGPSDAVSLYGDEAEAELARILHVEAGLGSKAIAAQWAHLWIWQGKAGEDPSIDASAQRRALVQRLQDIGGAAALQSEQDSQIASQFSAMRETIFNKAGRPKTGSSLELAERAVESAKEKHSSAAERMRKLEAAAADFETASKTLSSSGEIINRLEAEREATESRARTLVELRRLEAEQAAAVKTAAARRDAVESAGKQISQAREDIAALKKSLTPRNEAIARLESELQSAKDNATAADAESRKAAVAVRDARNSHELADSHLQLLERAEIFKRVSDKEKKVSKLRAALAELEAQLSKLPGMDRSSLHKAQRLESECSSAQASLQAMATGIEVIAADRAVKAGRETIKAGQRKVLTEDTVICIDSNVRLRIEPGGGTSLADARKTWDGAAEKLRKYLDSFGLSTVKEAIEVNARLEDLSSRVKAARAELEGMEAENIEEELRNARNDLASTKANIERLVVLAPKMGMPEDLQLARAQSKSLRKRLDEAEDREAEAKSVSTVSARKLQASEEALRAERNDAAQQILKLNGREAQLDLLLRTHGDEATQSRELSELKTVQSATQKLLDGTTASISKLQPDLLEGDRMRIERAIKQVTAEQNEARSMIAVSRAALRSDGSEDPASDLATAEARVRSAEEHRQSLQMRAQAIDLLDRLFRDEQRDLAERFTRPLAEKISAYLKCIFGAGAVAQISMGDDGFTGLRLSRPSFGNAPFEFGSLSGGAKEQTAAAVRLAMAEVLAADYDGCLPVVFDDAFANSDPRRVNELQRMLDLAAKNGLQVIVLTCNPADYAALGAKQVFIRPEPLTSRAPGSQVPEASERFPDEPLREANEPPPQYASISETVVTEELRSELLSALANLGGSSGNVSLRDRLGWDEATYWAVKSDLLNAGKLLPGKGRGGSVSLPVS
jgi:DNA repair exonuclease SbcCD ATPase subunit